MHPAFDHPKAVVRPRTRTYRRLPVVAIAGNMATDENGTIVSLENLIKRLPLNEPTLFVKQSSADFLAELDKRFGDMASWQWRVSTHERDICKPDGTPVAARVSTLIHFFGWKNGNFHKLIEPVSFHGRSLNEINPGEESVLYRLLQWGVYIRDFCDQNNLEIRPTGGAIGSQFLTDPRFYPMARRKVPASTNLSVREQLPGNHYYLNVPPSTREYTAVYLDQHRAHHYHASTIGLPAADSLYAHGRFWDCNEITLSQIPENFYGLYCLDLDPPKRRLPFDWLPQSQLERVFVYTNELQHLLDAGYTVKGVRAAWGSRFRDDGLRHYAIWAMSQLDTYGDAAWLKPLLLSTYGTLATRPKQIEFILKQCKQGESVTLRTGHSTLTGLWTQTRRKLEPGIANVLHRGMIEAATRSESIGLAQALDFAGYRILSIYADAVIVQLDDDKPDLPHLPEPWRSKGTLNHLQFINQQAFLSGEMTKLPGVGRDILKYRQQSPRIAAKQVPMYNALSGEKVLKPIGALKGP